MARFGIFFGLLLCCLTVLGLVVSVKVPSQFIPMMIGIPIMLCSIVGLNPHRRQRSMRGAASVGVLGLVVGACLSIHLGTQWYGGELADIHVLRVVLAMVALCLIFVIVCGVSLYQTRKSI